MKANSVAGKWEEEKLLFSCLLSSKYNERKRKCYMTVSIISAKWRENTEMPQVKTEAEEKIWKKYENRRKPLAAMRRRQKGKLWNTRNKASYKSAKWLNHWYQSQWLFTVSQLYVWPIPSMKSLINVRSSKYSFYPLSVKSNLSLSTEEKHWQRGGEQRAVWRLESQETCRSRSTCRGSQTQRGSRESREASAEGVAAEGIIRRREREACLGCHRLILLTSLCLVSIMKRRLGLPVKESYDWPMQKVFLCLWEKPKYQRREKMQWLEEKTHSNLWSSFINVWEGCPVREKPISQKAVKMKSIEAKTMKIYVCLFWNEIQKQKTLSYKCLKAEKRKYSRSWRKLRENPGK